MAPDDVDQVGADEDLDLQAFDAGQIGRYPEVDVLVLVEDLNGFQVVAEAGSADQELLHDRPRVCSLTKGRVGCWRDAGDLSPPDRPLRHEDFGVLRGGPMRKEPQSRATSANFAVGKWKADDGIGSG